MNTLSLAPLMKNSIGFDNLENLFNQTFSESNFTSSFPHYNIVKSDENNYEIILALAGYSKENIEIIHKKNNLSISGMLEENELDFIHRGIASRKFERNFELADYVEISSAKMINGLLTINLKKNVPLELQPKKININ